jgi:hypothetical protein
MDVPPDRVYLVYLLCPGTKLLSYSISVSANAMMTQKDRSRSHSIARYLCIMKVFCALVCMCARAHAGPFVHINI